MDLRWYQSESCAAAWQWLCTMPGNPVICLPTGAGKSVVIAELARAACQEYSGRVMVLAHRTELLEQNAGKVASLLPFGLTCGLYSAGLRRFNDSADVVCAGIQSCWRKASLFGSRHLALIDEAHLVSDDGASMYRKFIADLCEINPRLRLIGLTATPFRTDNGPLCRADALFQKICYEAKIQPLIADGFLSPVVNKPSEVEFDTSRLHIRGGEFIPSEVERLFEGDEKVLSACREIVAKCASRKSIIVFCSGIAHSEHVAECLEKLTGERVGKVTGQTLALERGSNLEEFKSGHLRWLVNVDVLTTGFDAPNIDAIAILRATMSPGLFVQICGRGLRRADGKADCLILDFGQNIKRHGPIDAIDYGRPRITEGDGTGQAPTKTCPACEEDVHAGLLECHCGFRFPDRELKHDHTSDESSKVLAEPELWHVVSVDMHRHAKKKASEGTPDTLRVNYTCQPMGKDGNLTEQKISEWVCLEHPTGYARTKAGLWWNAHSKAPFPKSIDEAIDLWQRGAVAMPVHITTERDGKWYRIISAEIEPLPTEWRHAEPEYDWDDTELPF